MRIGWIGFHREGLTPLRALLTSGAPVVAVVTLEPDVAATKSGHADYAALGHEFNVPLHFVRHINHESSIALLESLQLDVAFVIGWAQIVSPRALATARLGMIGAHASLLPEDRGRAPINWALIKGRQRTGNTLMWLAPDVDAGDIIERTAIPITPYDTCATLYDKVADATRDMILRVVPSLLASQRPGRPQGPSPTPLLPARRPEDGEIDWRLDNITVYNFIRAITRPYPGAFGWLGDSRVIVWQSALLPNSLATRFPPGSVIGPVVSPVDAACGQAVACGEGGVILLEVEDAHGAVISGRELSEQQWSPRAWRTNAAAGAGRRRSSG
jgi:methionyl-tRNA formyltransferase